MAIQSFHPLCLFCAHCCDKGDFGDRRLRSIRQESSELIPLDLRCLDVRVANRAWRRTCHFLITLLIEHGLIPNQFSPVWQYNLCFAEQCHFHWIYSYRTVRLLSPCDVGPTIAMGKSSKAICPSFGLASISADECSFSFFRTGNWNTDLH